MGFVWVIAAIAIAAALAAWLGDRAPRLAGVLGAALAAVVLAAVFRAMPGEDGPAPAAAWEWLPALGLSAAVRLDGLAALFAVIVTGVGVPVLAYAGAYAAGEHGAGRLLALLLAFMGAMLMLVAADDLLLMYVAWELTTLCSFFLVGFHGEKAEARAAAWHSLLVTAAGGLAMLAGLVLVGQAAGTYRISAILADPTAVQAAPTAPAAALLVLAGAFSKSAQVPLHSWLPRAMAAPTPASAYLHAAAMVNAGIFLVARLAPALAGPVWRGALLAVGGATLAWCSVRALLETDLKRLLAFSTAGALGLVLFLLGVGTPYAVQAALLYLLAHALYKGALFLAAGAIDHATGTRDLRELSGLGRLLPWTTAGVLAAAVSMAGLPPALGFVAKEAALGAGRGAAAALLVVPSAAFVAAALLLGRAAIGRPRTPGPPHPSPLALVLAPAALALAGLAAPFAPGVLGSLVQPAAAAVAGADVPKLEVWHAPGLPLVLTVVAAALGVAAALALLRSPRLDAAAARLAGAWSRPRAFEGTKRGLLAWAADLTARLQEQTLRTHLAVVLLVLAGVIAAAWLGARWAPAHGGLRPGFEEWAICATVLVAGATAVKARSRIGAIAAMGTAGYGISLLFLSFGAPDLAMTQFAVETLTVVVFVLAFRRLPRYARLSSTRRRLRDGVIAIAAGGALAFLLLASGTPGDRPASQEMLARSVPEGLGRNVVNVILVDFRALDTLGEVTVLCVAAAGVASLLQRAAGRDEARP